MRFLDEVVTNPFPENCAVPSGICGWIVKDAPAWASNPEPFTTEISDTCSNYRFVQLNGKKTGVATLWSNTANKGKGGCVARYVSDQNQDLTLRPQPRRSVVIVPGGSIGYFERHAG